MSIKGQWKKRGDDWILTVSESTFKWLRERYELPENSSISDVLEEAGQTVEDSKGRKYDVSGCKPVFFTTEWDGKVFQNCGFPYARKVQNAPTETDFGSSNTDDPPF